MDDPVTEIPGVIHALTQSRPSVQRETIEKYFTQDATFIHPFCRTPRLQDSRWIILAIYRWYKVLSPRIDLSIQSVGYDAPNLRLYVTVHQIFRLWFVPFYKAPVTLVTVLDLAKVEKKYRIQQQEDLYQTDKFISFVPLFPGGSLVVMACQYFAALFCVVGAMVLRPFTWLAENRYPGGWKGVALE
ncbi:hypothetical protein P152DRAFT_476563 [Eremomyces bilateralis CBS 781.70]|uniref:SigF-like NTF2-like domain-containing protein n=1 Tax=Eremomyces bilateralis CBS 781.70 TaxID=1392243 RepID=A0A6G1FUH7_9PEZI|nr:uncharacterized protein P152DRAFT_476563 [Eremomyces bilateralis CBS 781.70]KAF1809434.1 hypothetical protein P152DRAFT_476563 [Eremomyces bilateralis CBS 781.70]